MSACMGRSVLIVPVTSHQASVCLAAPSKHMTSSRSLPRPNGRKILFTTKKSLSLITAADTNFYITTYTIIAEKSFFFLLLGEIYERKTFTLQHYYIIKSQQQRLVCHNKKCHELRFHWLYNCVIWHFENKFAQ